MLYVVAVRCAMCDREICSECVIVVSPDRTQMVGVSGISGIVGSMLLGPLIPTVPSPAPLIHQGRMEPSSERTGIELDIDERQLSASRPSPDRDRAESASAEARRCGGLLPARDY